MLKSAVMRLPESIRRPLRNAYHVWKAPRIHEPEFDWIEPYLSGPVIDVGANIGKFTYFCAQRSPRVIAIEPARDNFRTLRMSKALYRLKNVRLIHAAASNQNGNLRFSVPKFSDGSPDLYECHVADNGTFDFEVNAITIDSLGLRPTFIKIDVEGHELEVLQGATKTLESRPALLVEILHQESEELLRDLGYTRTKSHGVNGLFVSNSRPAHSMSDSDLLRGQQSVL